MLLLLVVMELGERGQRVSSTGVLIEGFALARQQSTTLDIPPGFCDLVIFRYFHFVVSFAV
jgi:hypothetical protein